MTDEREAEILRQIAATERGTWREALRSDFAPWLDDLFWGIQCGDGWAGIIRALTTEIAGIVGGPDATPSIRIVQIKEKFGTLRYYVSNVPEAHDATVEAAIARAERPSGTTCEACGRRGRLRQTDLGYWYTACDDHAVD